MKNRAALIILTKILFKEERRSQEESELASAKCAPATTLLVIDINQIHL